MKRVWTTPIAVARRRSDRRIAIWRAARIAVALGGVTWAFSPPQHSDAACAPWGPCITVTPPSVGGRGEGGGGGGGGREYGGRESSGPSVDYSHLEGGGCASLTPAEGWTWVNPNDPDDLRVRRVSPGTASHKYPHVVISDSQGNYRPEDGYTWVNPNDSSDLRVRWVPGKASSEYQHVVASSAEGRWLPADGYTWVVNPPVAGDLRVRWEPGRESGDHPHVVASSTEGQWHADDGYAWVDPSNSSDLRVRWIQGKASTEHPHIVTSGAEGRWLPAPGYGWVVSPPVPGDMRVTWQPGSMSSDRPHVIASSTEGSWYIEDGYVWVHPSDSADLTVQPAAAGTPSRDHPNAVWDGNGNLQPAPGYVWASNPPSSSGYQVMPAPPPLPVAEGLRDAVTGTSSGAAAGGTSGTNTSAGAQLPSTKVSGAIAQLLAQLGGNEAASMKAREGFDTAGQQAGALVYPNVTPYSPDVVALATQIPETARQDPAVRQSLAQYMHLDALKREAQQKIAEIEKDKDKDPPEFHQAKLETVQNQVRQYNQDQAQAKQQIQKRVIDLGLDWNETPPPASTQGGAALATPPGDAVPPPAPTQ